MKDNFGREINYLRVSLTQQCNLTCLYCGHSDFRGDILTPREIEIYLRCFAACGIDKVRFTGGEPLMRRDICEIVGIASHTEGICSVALTTNGTMLAKYAEPLKKAGLSSLNVSIDSIDKGVYETITRGGDLEKVFAGIDAAKKCGLKVKLNSVILRGVNEHSVAGLVEYAVSRGTDLRFIELMPFSQNDVSEKLMVSGDEIKKQIDGLVPLERNSSDGPAEYYGLAGTDIRIGFISSVSSAFCRTCNRIRLLADGSVRPCLGFNKSFPLKKFIDDEILLSEKIREAVSAKPLGHRFAECSGCILPMNFIGG